MIEPAIREVTASDGYRLHFRLWNPETIGIACRGIVIALHGIQSHSGWYEYSSRRMAEAGFAVYFADRRGSGLNGIQRGHASHAMRLVNDVRTLRQLAIAETSSSSANSLPVTLQGISWGGKIASAAAALFPEEFQRLVLMYPGLAPRLQLSLWQRFRLNIARDFEIVKKHIPIPLDNPALFTQVPEWQSFIAHDPLALHTVTSSFLNSGRELDRIVKVHASRIQQPVLVMLAKDDAIIDNLQVRHQVDEFGSRHSTTLIYSNARHTLEFEPQRETIFSELIQWLASVA